MACADMGKNKKGKGRKLKEKKIYIYRRKKRKTDYFILLYTTFLDFVGVSFWILLGFLLF